MTRTQRPCSPAYWALSFLAIIQIGLADDIADRLSEEQVKAATEYTATLGICSNSTLLDLANIESSRCEKRLSNYSAFCWQELDRLKLNYELAKDESGQDTFVAISLAYESCLRAALLYKIVHEKDKSDFGYSDESEVAETDYTVHVLGCYMPVPARFVLNATADEYYFFDSSDDDFGSLRINDYDEEGLSELLEISDVLERTERDGRVAMLIASHLDGAPAEGFKSAILHDYERVVTIIGNEVPNWRKFLDSCIANPSAQKPPAHPLVDKAIRDTIRELKTSPAK